MPGVIVERSIELLSNLEPKLLALKKYESNFSPEATQLLNVAISSISKHKALVVGWPSGPGLSAYLLTGAKTDELKKSLIESQHAVTGLMSGSMPLPRSAKEDLQNLRNELLGLKMDSSAEQTEVVKRLQTLYVDLTDKSKEADVDAIEEKLDDVMRQVLQNVFGSTSLPDEEVKIKLNALELSVESAKAGEVKIELNALELSVESAQAGCVTKYAAELKTELNALELSVESAKAGGVSKDADELKIELNALELSVESAKAGSGSNDAAVLSLALNSMQRLHASQLKSEEEEEEEEEEEFNTEDERLLASQLKSEEEEEEKEEEQFNTEDERLHASQVESEEEEEEEEEEEYNSEDERLHASQLESEEKEEEEEEEYNTEDEVERRLDDPFYLPMLQQHCEDG
eukprot:gene21815-28838_t